MNLFKKVAEFFAAPPDSIEPLFELLADQQARIEQLEARIRALSEALCQHLDGDDD